MKTLVWLLTIALLLILVMVWRSRDDTVYAPGFSEAKFKSIRVGMRKEEVIRLLGEPLRIEDAPGYIYWGYAQDEQGKVISSAKNRPWAPSDITFHADLRGKIIRVYGGPNEMIGHPLEDVRKQFGDPAVLAEPNRSLYWYSEMKGIKGQYVRFIIINDTGLVGSISAGRLGHYLGVEGERPSGLLEWLEWYVF